MTTILVVILAAGAALAGAAAAVQRARRRATECDLAERQQQLAAREAEAEGLRRELSTVRISTEGGSGRRTRGLMGCAPNSRNASRSCESCEM